MIASQIQLPSTAVHSKGSTSTAASFQLGPVVEGRRTAKARVHVRLTDNTGNAEVRVVYWTSADGVTFSGAGSTLASYTSFVSASDWTWGTAFDTITGAGWVRFGLEVRNTTGTNLERVRVEVEIETLSA